MKVVATEVYCLMAVATHLRQGVEMHVFTEGAGIVNIAGIVSSLEENGYDPQRGVIMSAAEYEGLITRHLVKEYLKNEDTNQLSVRYSLTPCPHGSPDRDEDAMLRALDSATTVGQ